jgi:hypothetical protein
MRRHADPVVDRFEKLFDRDVETLISGGSPDNSDLAPLREFISDLRSMGDLPVSDGFIELHAAESAAAAARAHAQNPATRSASRTRNLWVGLRRRATASAMTLMMLFGAAGMAMAADDAVPGDWDYGLDRALEAIGIGAGGASERAEEMGLTPADDAGTNDSFGTEEQSPVEQTGLDRAATVIDVPTRGSDESESARRRVADILKELDDDGKVDGGFVSDSAKDDAGPPEDDEQPQGANAGGGKPDPASDAESPGRGSPPESPGKSGRP